MDGDIDSHTEAWTEGQTDRLIPVYPQKYLFHMGIKIIKSRQTNKFKTQEPEQFNY